MHHARKNNQALESEWHDVRVLGLAMFSPTPRSRAIKLQTWLEKLNTRKILINFCLFANYWSFKSIVWYCKHLIDVTILVLSSAQYKKLLLSLLFICFEIKSMQIKFSFLAQIIWLNWVTNQMSINVYQRIYDKMRWRLMRGLRQIA